MLKETAQQHQVAELQCCCLTVPPNFQKTQSSETPLPCLRLGNSQQRNKMPTAANHGIHSYVLQFMAVVGDKLEFAWAWAWAWA
jgi:hypothetical protein